PLPPPLDPALRPRALPALPRAPGGRRPPPPPAHGDPRPERAPPRRDDRPVGALAVGFLRTAAALAAAAALVLTATACGERSEPTGADVSPYPVTVQGAGDQPTALDHRPLRIAPLDPAVATLLIELNAQRQLVGLPRRGGPPSIWGLTGAPPARPPVR